ncbi:MAG: hypothetical protein BMS9Abin37_3305 [Acidobacteriota bacterium]|nr:MAG: hypothetical protein BMS9Abin37_3305 [Acidobacteriota bacterium]
MIVLRQVLVLAAVLYASTALVAGAQKAPDPRMQAPTEYSIGAGDVLQIVTWKEVDFSGSFLVRYDGRITMPLVGDILVSGRTPEQLSKELEEAVGRFVEMARVTVAIEEPNSAQFFVLGKVAQQGAFPYTRPIRVAQALALAGGFQEFAKLNQIFVIREVDGRLIYFPFNYDDFMDKRKLGGNLVLRPGDTIVVP